MTPEQLAATLTPSKVGLSGDCFPDAGDDDAIVADFHIGTNGAITFPAAKAEAEAIETPTVETPAEAVPEEAPAEVPQLTDDDLLPGDDPFAELDTQYSEIATRADEAVAKVRELQTGDGTGVAEFTAEVDEAVEARRSLLTEADQVFLQVQANSLAIVEANFPEFNDGDSKATLMLEAAVAENTDKYGASPTAIAKKAVEIAERLNLLPQHERQAPASKPISQPAATPVAKQPAPPVQTVAAPVPPTSPLPSSSQTSYAVAVAPPQGGAANDIVSQLRNAGSDYSAFQKLMDEQLGGGPKTKSVVTMS